MTETVVTAAPLTRREAREIERRTGSRHFVGAVAPVSLPLPPAPETVVPDLSFAHDTAEIERNPDTGLVSVFPTELIDSVADVAPEDGTAAAFVRPVSIRAARPASLVARTRRRTAFGVGIAASAAVLATAAVAVPGVSAHQQQAADQQAAQAAQANLLSADTVAAGDPQINAATQVQAPASALVAAPTTATDRGDFTVTAFSADEVDGSVVETAAPAATAEATASTGGSSTGTSYGDSTADSSGGSSSTPTGSGSSYGGDLSGVAGIAQSMMGGGYGWRCTDFTRAVYAQMGISLPGGGVSAQAAGGTPTSNPQVGDLVIFSSGHLGIYAGGGMMWDNPGYYSSYVGWQNVYRSMDVIGSSYYFVTYR